MSDQFFNSPILNSPYEEPSRHWELDDITLKSIANNAEIDTIWEDYQKVINHLGDEVMKVVEV